jgi:hypothetical protein
LVAVATKFSLKSEKNPVALFFSIALAAPMLKAEVAGFAGIRSIIELDYIRILTLAVLMPLCLAEFKNKKSREKSRYGFDYILGGYILLCLILQAVNDSVTGLIRSTIYWSIDVIIPYYAISRGVKNIESVREISASISLSCLIVAAVAIFEFYKSWLLYIPMSAALGLNSDPFYLQRGDYVRAIGPTSQAIALGFVLVVGVAAFSYLRNYVKHRCAYLVGLLILLLGEIASLSKGPWLGLILFISLYVFTGRNVLRYLVRAIIVLVPAVIFLMTSELGEEITAYLPFVGTLDTGSQTYRELLLTKSLEIIYDNPIFGSTDFLLRMEDLRQGQGIIDLVNTYLIVALSTGLLGLGLYCAFFVAVLTKLFGMISVGSKEDVDVNLLARFLFSCVTSMLFIIIAVSPIAQIPIFIWTVSALACSVIINYSVDGGKLEKI